MLSYLDSKLKTADANNIIGRVALSIDAGKYTFEAGVNEAIRDIEDLFEGHPHGYDIQRVQREVLDKINAKRNSRS